MAHLNAMIQRIAIALLLIIAAVLLTAPATIPRAYADGPTEQEQRARAIARELQCPICENNSILDSPSELARDMRQIVSEQVAAGRSRDEILRYFVDRYGEGVLRAPPKQGFTLLVWVGPFIALGIAVAVVTGVLRGRTARAAPVEADADAPLASADTARYAALVEHEVARLEEGRR